MTAQVSKICLSAADVKFFGSQDVLISASSDNTSRIWRASGDDGAMVAAAVLKTHGAEVRTPSGLRLVQHAFPKALRALAVQCLPTALRTQLSNCCMSHSQRSAIVSGHMCVPFLVCRLQP